MAPYAASLGQLLQPRAPALATPTNTAPVNPDYVPGAGSFDPQKISNKGIFALFALIGLAFVLTAIWFFFWAKNGGFQWREGDWEDYKSTVLRRKGPNGTTLSGATRTTKLGGGSVIASEVEEKDEKRWKNALRRGGNKIGNQPRGNKNTEDEDVRAYRHEKPARVGGLNRETDGVNYAKNKPYSDQTDQPETAFQVPLNTPRAKRTTGAGLSGNPTTPSPHHGRKKSALYGTPASNASTDSHRPLRPNAASPATGTSTPTRSRNASPRKSGTIPGSFDGETVDYETRYSQSEAGYSDGSRGTRSYYHSGPGLARDGGRRGGYAGGRPAAAAGAGGYRRGRGRRDSLSDSEGETMMS